MTAFNSKPKIKLTIIKEEKGYTATGQWKDRSLITCGDTWEELQNMIIDMLNLVFEDLGYKYAIQEVEFTYDLPSFFDFYKVLNVSALSKQINMPQSLLAQYISGKKKPSATQKARILKGVQQVGRELMEINFLL
jgi:hypothetical protein